MHVKLSCLGCLYQATTPQCTETQLAGGVNAVFTILTRSLVRMRMPLQAFRASSHLEYDSLVLHREVPNAHGIAPEIERELSMQATLCRTFAYG